MLNIKNKILWICVIGVVLSALSFAARLQNKVFFPPGGLECYDGFDRTKDNQYEDPSYNLPKFNLEDITHFRCANGHGFHEYEVSGTDVEGHTFYVHHSTGGMAASGADGYDDFCMKKDGVVVTSHMVAGRSPVIEGEGTCAFGTHNFNIPIETEYNYSK